MHAYDYTLMLSSASGRHFVVRFLCVLTHFHSSTGIEDLVQTGYIYFSSYVTSHRFGSNGLQSFAQQIVEM